jgi:hypothetical protein
MLERHKIPIDRSVVCHLAFLHKSLSQPFSALEGQDKTDMSSENANTERVIAGGDKKFKGT